MANYIKHGYTFSMFTRILIRFLKYANVYEVLIKSGIRLVDIDFYIKYRLYNKKDEILFNSMLSCVKLNNESQKNFFTFVHLNVMILQYIENMIFIYIMKKECQNVDIPFDLKEYTEIDTHEIWAILIYLSYFRNIDILRSIGDNDYKENFIRTI